MVYTANNVRLG